MTTDFLLFFNLTVLYKNNPVYPSSLQATIWNDRITELVNITVVIYLVVFVFKTKSNQNMPKKKKVTNTAEQMAVYDGKLENPKWIKRENMGAKKKCSGLWSNTERQSHDVVYK